MRLSFSTLTCPSWSFPEIVGAAAAYGFRGIDLRGIGDEIDVTRLALFDDELDSTLELLRRHELSIPCMNTSIALVTPAVDRWEMMLEECQRYARLASRTSTPYVRVFGGAVIRGMTHAEATAMARRHLRQLEKICGAHGCLMLLETHDAWSTSAQVLELLEGFSEKEIGVLWDIEHPWRIGESPSATAAGLERYIRHVHFKDCRQETGKRVPSVVGEGELPLRQCIAALQSIGYDDWICLELEKRWQPDGAPEPEQSLPAFVAFMKENWPEHDPACRSGAR
jgi:sugar phosphate isomerase/epimerase